MKAPLFRRAREGGVFRISPADTNKFVLAVDPVADKAPFLSVIEIFEPGGKTPLHKHDRAHEMFYVLSGRGRAHCGGKTYEMAKGDTLVLPPGLDHVVENAGRRRLYCLTVMLPNEGLAELIRAGQPMALDATDRAVVSAPRSRSGSSRGRASSRRSPAATASAGRGRPRKGRG
ncbi:cupin domain-containing protein [Reyranella sp.]|uniref:cupin domain-containing protein n=1 Tax=Reyranella sp. TaxID=1929291 RepID=UPI003BA8A6F4